MDHLVEILIGFLQLRTWRVNNSSQTVVNNFFTYLFWQWFRSFSVPVEIFFTKCSVHSIDNRQQVIFPTLNYDQVSTHYERQSSTTKGHHMLFYNIFCYCLCIFQKFPHDLYYIIFQWGHSKTGHL